MKTKWVFVFVAFLAAFGLVMMGCNLHGNGQNWGYTPPPADTPSGGGPSGDTPTPPPGGGGVPPKVLYDNGTWAAGVTAVFTKAGAADNANLNITFTPALDVTDYSKVVILVSDAGYTDWWVGGVAHNSDGVGDDDWFDFDTGATTLEIPISTCDDLEVIDISGGGNTGYMNDGANSIAKITLVE
jgi:hypothetical protein